MIISSRQNRNNLRFAHNLLLKASSLCHSLTHSLTTVDIIIAQWFYFVMAQLQGRCPVWVIHIVELLPQTNTCIWCFSTYFFSNISKIIFLRHKIISFKVTWYKMNTADMSIILSSPSDLRGKFLWTTIPSHSTQFLCLFPLIFYYCWEPKMSKLFVIFLLRLQKKTAQKTPIIMEIHCKPLEE